MNHSRHYRIAYCLDQPALRCLLAIDAVCAAIWLTAMTLANAILLSSGNWTATETMPALFGAHWFLLQLNDFVVVPSAASVLVASALIGYAVCQSARLPRRIGAVLVFVPGFVLLSTIFFGAWVVRSQHIVETQHWLALVDPAYHSCRTMIFALNISQLVVVLLPALAIKFQPWKMLPKIRLDSKRFPTRQKDRLPFRQGRRSLPLPLLDTVCSK